MLYALPEPSLMSDTRLQKPDLVQLKVNDGAGVKITELMRPLKVSGLTGECRLITHYSKTIYCTWEKWLCWQPS